MNYCLHCEKETKNPKFCSRSCAAKKNNKVPKRKLKKKCRLCETPIRSNRTFCSEHNPLSRDMPNTTLSEMKQKRKYQKHSVIRSYARKIYLNSDKPKYCINCGYDKHFHVCHVKAIKDFDPSATLHEINNLDNLLALCPNCHWELDNSLLKFISS